MFFSRCAVPWVSLRERSLPSLPAIPPGRSIMLSVIVTAFVVISPWKKQCLGSAGVAGMRLISAALRPSQAEGVWTALLGKPDQGHPARHWHGAPFYIFHHDDPIRVLRTAFGKRRAPHAKRTLQEPHFPSGASWAVSDRWWRKNPVAGCDVIRPKVSDVKNPKKIALDKLAIALNCFASMTEEAIGTTQRRASARQ